jgi:GNAT superfamily N-acetyltransferase
VWATWGRARSPAWPTFGSPARPFFEQQPRLPVLVTSASRLRKRLPGYPLPVLRLARLGVDTRAQGLGLGKALLRHVITLALEQRDSLGCIGIVTDAKVEAVPFYEALGFISLGKIREGLLVEEPVPMFLAIDTAARATEPGARK